MSAVFSECGRYRYRLDRVLPPALDASEGMVLFCCLNPSKAGQQVDGAEISDPSATRMAGFTKAWGYSRFAIVNLAAYIATDPKELARLDYRTAVGPDTDRHIARAAADAALIVAAWGASYPAELRWRPAEVYALLTRVSQVGVHHLGLTKQGDPRHPLYLPASTQPVRWEAA